MRILICGGFHFSAYPILRSLRAHTDTIGLAYPAGPRADVALSQYLDFVRPVPQPSLVSRAGYGTSPDERAFVESLQEICRCDRIDVLLPTSDLELLVLTKHKDRFRRAGVTIPAPSHAALLRALDKFRSYQIAGDVGFPVPRTARAEQSTEVSDLIRIVGFPLIVKPRIFSSGSKGVRLVVDETELRAAIRDLSRWTHGTLVQEYVPGTSEQSLFAIADNKHVSVFTVFLRKHRYLSPSISTFIESVDGPAPLAKRAEDLISAVGLVGPLSLQMKRDERDGVLKLVEINPRWGANSRILIRMCDEDAMDPLRAAINASRGDRAGSTVFPSGRYGVSPVEDLCAWRTYRRRQARVGPRSGHTLKRSKRPRPPLLALARDYIHSYRLPLITDYFWASREDDRESVVSSYRKTLSISREALDLVSWSRTRNDGYNTSF